MTCGLITLNMTLVLSELSHPYLNAVFYSLAIGLSNTLIEIMTLLTLLMFERVRPFPLLEAADGRLPNPVPFPYLRPGFPARLTQGPS